MPDAPERISRLATCGHAFLILGRTTRLRRDGARELAAQLLGTPGLELDSTHLDLYVLHPEEDKTQIGIDACRNLIERLSLTPSQGQARVGVIDPAWALTADAQNAMLKFAEDPGPYGKVLFLCRRKEDILPTLLSRCLQIHCRGPLTADDILPLAPNADGDTAELLEFLKNIDSADLAGLSVESGVLDAVRQLVDHVDDEATWGPEALQPFHRQGGGPEISAVFLAGCIAGGVKKLRQTARHRQSGRWQKTCLLLLAMNRELRYHPSRGLLIEAARKAVFNPYAGSPI